MALAIAPCRQLCDWVTVAPAYDVTMLACAGCGSQWVPSQAWTPVQADGTMPAAVSALRAAEVGSGGSESSNGS